MEALAVWSPAPRLNVTKVERENSRWLVVISGRERACCLLCGVQSRSRHSFYVWTLGDLSAQGIPVTIRVRVGRWRCRNERCDRHIFPERFPGLAGPSARQTDRLAEIVRLFGHGAGGRPSGRLMVRLGMRVSDSTILRRVKHHAEAVELATFEWVDWFNHRRLLEPIGNIPPAEAEARYYEHLNELPMAA